MRTLALLLGNRKLSRRQAECYNCRYRESVVATGVLVVGCITALLVLEDVAVKLRS
jgi:hypothetical protein